MYKCVYGIVLETLLKGKGRNGDGIVFLFLPPFLMSMPLMLILILIQIVKIILKLFIEIG